MVVNYTEGEGWSKFPPSNSNQTEIVVPVVYIVCVCIHGMLNRHVTEHSSHITSNQMPKEVSYDYSNSS